MAIRFLKLIQFYDLTKKIKKESSKTCNEVGNGKNTWYVQSNGASYMVGLHTEWLYKCTTQWEGN